jgi:hypothetical protein
MVGCCNTQPHTVLVCPKLKTYSALEQNQQADAESALSENSPLVEPLLEWSDLRSQLKVCDSQ